MSDAGEGLIDADARIQERMDELEEAKKQARRQVKGDPEVLRRIESLRLARTDLEQQLEVTTHDARRQMLRTAIAELDKQAEALEPKPAPAARPARSKK